MYRVEYHHKQPTPRLSMLEGLGIGTSFEHPFAINGPPNIYFYRTVLDNAPHRVFLRNHRDESFCHRPESRLPRQPSQHCVTAPFVEQEVQVCGHTHDTRTQEAARSTAPTFLTQSPNLARRKSEHTAVQRLVSGNRQPLAREIAKVAMFLNCLLDAVHRLPDVAERSVEGSQSQPYVVRLAEIR